MALDPRRVRILAALCVPEPDDNRVVQAMRRAAADELREEVAKLARPVRRRRQPQ